MNESFVTVVGNMVADPTLRTGKNGRHFATFRVASTTRRRDPGSGAYVDSGTNYVSVVVFNGLAANVVASLKKGEPVIVYGRLRVNQWVGSQNQPMTSVEVEGYNAGHDLTWGQAKYAKRGRVQFDTADRLGDPEYPGLPARGRGSRWFAGRERSQRRRTALPIPQTRGGGRVRPKRSGRRDRPLRGRQHRLTGDGHDHAPTSTTGAKACSRAAKRASAV